MTLVNSTIRRALGSGNPVIQGNRVIFIWEGNSAPQLIGDFTGWDGTLKRFKRVSSTHSTSLTVRAESSGGTPVRDGRAGPKSTSGKTIWSCSLTVPRDAYIEYLFYDPLSGENFLDPLNKRTVSNGFD